MKALVIIEMDGKGFSVYTNNLATVLHGSGATVEQARQEMINGYHDLLDYYKENNIPVPCELEGLSFEYKYDISAFLNAFAFLNVSKFAQRIGISPSLMRHYKAGDTYISDTQAKKIEAGLHEVAKELAAVTLR